MAPGIHVKPNGWAEMACPFCSDKGRHLQINPARTWARCFRCNASVPISEVLEATGYIPLPPPETDAESTYTPPKQTTTVQEFEPVACHKAALKYLTERNVLEYALLHKWKYATKGRFFNRIIIPVSEWYLGRSIAPSPLRYLGVTGAPYNKVWYNRESLEGKRIAVITEGVFDAISVQQALPHVGSIAGLGKQVSKDKAAYLASLGLDEVVLMLDSPEKDEHIQASIAAASITLVNGYRLSYATLPFGDPNSVPVTVLQSAFTDRTIIRA